MVESGGHPRGHYFKRGFQAGTRADRQPPQEAERRNNADFHRACEMCGLRVVIGLRNEPTEKSSVQLLPL